MSLGTFRQRSIRRRWLFGITTTAMVTFIVFAIGSAGGQPTPNCTTPNHLTGSNFEIDVNANLKVDGAANCIDWLQDGTGSAFRSDVAKKNDTTSGPTDESFGQGTKEDTANPTIVTGSIPPNKSDLKVFGVLKETTTAGNFLELFWSRINSPQGTTNMDFELNQKFCDPSATPTNCAGNGVTPLRTIGDKLITYDLAQGGTVPTISIRSWDGSAWGPATVISGGANPDALGSVNTTTIPANEAGGAQPAGIGPQDPFTFGEAAIKFSALFPPGGQCGSFGSAYLKSRSSTAFNAELKDFIPPEQVTVTNCPAIATTLSASTITVGGSVSDSATLSNATGNAGGTVAYRYYSSLADCQADLTGSGGTGAGTKTVTNGVVPDSDSVTFNSTGTFYWAAFYSGDANNGPVKSDCTKEVLVVNKKQPSLTTSATASVTIGDPISDTATLSGGFSPTGTITFHLFSDSGCTNEVSTGLSPVTVNGNGDYNSGNFTPTAVGTYFWTASYSGDANNLAASTACGDANESSVVNKAESSIATVQRLFPQDSATISALAGGTPTGNVTFSLYAPADLFCSGLAVFSQTVALSGGSAETSNTTFWVTAGTPGTYRWVVTYPGDDTHLGSTSACGTEQFTASITDS